MEGGPDSHPLITASAKLFGRRMVKSIWLTRAWRQIWAVCSEMRAHQSCMAASFAAVSSQTRPFVSELQTLEMAAYLLVVHIDLEPEAPVFHIGADQRVKLGKDVGQSSALHHLVCDGAKRLLGEGHDSERHILLVHFSVRRGKFHAE